MYYNLICGLRQKSTLIQFGSINIFLQASRVYIRVMVFNATFNNISVISWRSVLLVEETGVPIENHRPASSRRQTLLHNVASSIESISDNFAKSDT